MLLRNFIEKALTLTDTFDIKPRGSLIFLGLGEVLSRCYIFLATHTLFPLGKDAL